MISNIVRTAPALAFAILAIGATPAMAGETGVAESRIVHHDDLDLTRDGDVATLSRRVVQAATIVCGSARERDLGARAEARACRDETIAAHSDKIDLAVARARGGERLARADVPSPTSQH